jgi:hypothetical protein
MIFRDVILMFPLRRVGAPAVLEEGALRRVELACPFWANDCPIALSPRAYFVPSPSSCVIITATFTADVAVTGPSHEVLRTYNGCCIHALARINVRFTPCQRCPHHNLLLRRSLPSELNNFFALCFGGSIYIPVVLLVRVVCLE